MRLGHLVGPGHLVSRPFLRYVRQGEVIMPEPSCPGLASAAVLKGPQTGGFGVRKLSDPFSPPGVSPSLSL